MKMSPDRLTLPERRRRDGEETVGPSTRSVRNNLRATRLHTVVVPPDVVLFFYFYRFHTRLYCIYRYIIRDRVGYLY